MDWARDFEVMPFDSSVLRPLADAAAGAFEARTGKPLDASLAGAGDLPKALYKAPVCVMVVSDEKIAYANDAACEFAGKKHTELIGSATTLPATVADGYDSSYEKKLDGNTMQKAKRWAISKMAVVDGELVTEDQGVGYAFEAWVRDEDGALCNRAGLWRRRRSTRPRSRPRSTRRRSTPKPPRRRPRPQGGAGPRQQRPGGESSRRRAAEAQGALEGTAATAAIAPTSVTNAGRRHRRRVERRGGRRGRKRKRRRARGLTRARAAHARTMKFCAWLPLASVEKRKRTAVSCRAASTSSPRSAPPEKVAQLALLARLRARRLAHEVRSNNSHLALELVELQDLDQVGVSPFHGDGLGRLAVVVERAGVAAE